jgi:hypothetical protein
MNVKEEKKKKPGQVKAMPRRTGMKQTCKNKTQTLLGTLLALLTVSRVSGTSLFSNQPIRDRRVCLFLIPYSALINRPHFFP